MKMNRTHIFIGATLLMALVNLASDSAFSQSVGPLSSRNVTVELIQFKNQAENLYRDNIERALLTRLEAGEFTVTVDLALVKTVTPPTPTVEKIILPPSDPNAFTLPTLMGLVDAQMVIDSLNNKIEQLEATKTPIEPRPESSFSIRNASIRLGVSTAYPEAYRLELGQWLTQKARAELQIPVRVDTYQIQKPIEKPVEPPPPKTLVDWYKDFELSVVTLVVCGTLLFLMLIWFINRMLRFKHEQRLLEEQAMLDMQKLAEQSSLEESRSQRSQKDAESSKEKQIMIGGLDSEDLREARNKIAQIFDQLGEEKSAIIRRLIQQSQRGRIKAAILLDAWMFVQNEADRDNRTEWMTHFDDIRLYRYQTAVAIEKLKTLSEDEKKVLLREIYWDLLAHVSNNGLVGGILFENINELLSVEVFRIFTEQDLQAKALLFMELHPHHQLYIKLQLNDEDLKAVLMKSASLVYLTPDNLEMISKRIQTSFDNFFAGRVNLIHHFEQSLRVLDAFAEIDTLRKARLHFLNQGLRLERMIVTLAFLPQWRPQNRKALFVRAEANEVLALTQVFRDHTEIFISECPPMTQEMIQSDLVENIELSQDQLRSAIESLKAKLVGAIENKEIDYEAGYEEENVIGVEKYAA